ncbi:MAG TPA: hydroxymethylpyrimidine/phosphomethylpyrimidine kinase, partial [Myxococcales bacterium]|nr:hydroxymethylpyrimidine/phosphomethylpyrimidine kinase [Myxococcales bacterium]
MLDSPVCLSIAGSDSSGRAGIQADLQTFAAFDVYGTSAITAVTAQDRTGVASIHPVPTVDVRQQIQSVLSSFDVGAIKTGMLHDASIVRVVAQCVADAKKPLVIDPLVKASSGDALLSEDALGVAKKELFPLAAAITPNLPEAEALLNRTLLNERDICLAAAELSEQFGCAIVIKGGHGDDKSTDIAV